MCRSGRRGELLLEGLSLATEDKPAAAQHAHEGRVELVPQLGYATAEVVDGIAAADGTGAESMIRFTFATCCLD